MVLIVTVLLRAVLQFVLALAPISAVNGFDLNAWIRSFANFLALFLPAWAGYFTAKTQQNNFTYNLENHKSMIGKLTTIQQRLSHLLASDKTQLEVVNSLVYDITDAMIIQDTLEWKRKYKASVVKPL